MWIKLEDKLPEPGQVVIVYGSVLPRQKTYAVLVYKVDKDGSYFEEIGLDDPGAWLPYMVEHWAPFPLPLFEEQGK